MAKAPSKSAQRGPLVPQHKRLAQGEKVGKTGQSGAPKLPTKPAPKGKR